MDSSVHVPVLFDEVMGVLAPLAGKVMVDGTLGGGGHSLGFLNGGCAKLIACDWDERAAGFSRLAAERMRGDVICHHAGYDLLMELVGEGVADGILLDLGFSSDQLDDPERGLSYHLDGPLDMRTNSKVRHTAADILNRWREEDLANLFFDYGEEPKSRVLARAIVRERRDKPFAVTRDLLRVVEEIYPARPGLKRAHPAARIFQALRVMVNDEMTVLERALPNAARCLKPGGKLAVITFQPLEERCVKKIFRLLSEDELDEVGRVSQSAAYKMGKKIVPGEEEIAVNPRARSAILRVLERLR